MKSFLTSFLILTAFALQAQFSGDYAPANWATSHDPGCDNGYEDASGAPASVTIVGSENPGCGSSVVAYSTTVETCGTVSFDWNYTTVDCNGSFYDPFGYYLNGNPVQLTYDCFNCGYGQSGSASFSVAAGDVIAFYIWSRDNICGRAWSTISNFSGPRACDLTLSINATPTLYYGYGPLACTQATATATSSNGPVTLTWYENGNPGDGAVCATSGDCIVVTVTATDAACCVATASAEIPVIDATCYTPSGNPKVEICHNGHTICVSASAVPAHLAHGDPLGSCGETVNCQGEGLQVDAETGVIDAANHGATIQTRASEFTPSVAKLQAMSKTQAEFSNLEINPNPAIDIASVTVNRGIEGLASISIYNLNGQLMQKSTVDITRGVPVELNIANLILGNYTISVESLEGYKMSGNLIIGGK